MCLPDHLFRVVKLLIAAVVAAALDEDARFLQLLARFVAVVLAEEEARAVEVDAGQMEAHRAALGELLRFGEIGAGGGGVALEGA
jgi:hypothetical protein